MRRERVDFEPALRWLRERTGLVFPPHRRPDVERAIRRSADDAGCDVERVAERLAASPALFEDLIAELTVGETYFFREPDQLRHLRDAIVPEILARRPAGHTLRVWSAACSTGEEAYSLAIVLDDMGLGGRSHVLGTDISPRAIVRAREGRYRRWSLRGDAAAIVGDRVRPCGAGAYRVAEQIRRRVTFGIVNLVDDEIPSSANDTCAVDVILCRNALVYLEPRAAAAVAQKLARALADGGVLLVAATDPPLPDELPLEREILDAGVFYRQRPRAGDAPGRAPALAAPWSARRAASRVASRPERRRSTPGRYGAEDAAVEASRLRTLAGADPRQALRRADAVARNHPMAAEVHHLRAVLLLGEGRIEEAADAARRVLYLDPGLAVGHFLLGIVHQRLGNREAARRAYRSARDICAGRPPDEVVPLADGERAGRLAAAADAHCALLEGAGA